MGLSRLSLVALCAVALGAVSLAGLAGAEDTPQVPDVEQPIQQAIQPPMRPVIQPRTAPAPEPAAVQVVEETGPTLGPETNLPLPRYVSLKAGESNVRRGPSLTHRIDWVFVRRNMPLRVTAEYGHWRRVVDREGQGGWVHYSLLSGVRTVIIDEVTPVLTRPMLGAQEAAVFEAGVIARVDECERDWCRLSAGGYRGWAPKGTYWGVGAEELVD